MSKYFKQSLIEELKNSLALSITKKEHSERTSSAACSNSGKIYYAGLVESDTNTFNLPSEHVALVLSTISNDYKVSEIVTMVETESAQIDISPLVLKILIDHSIRTGITISYTIINCVGEIMISIENVCKAIPSYAPKPIILLRISEQPKSYVEENVNVNDKDIPSILKSFALQGLTKNFPLYDSASGYATAILTKSGKVFFAGQYSSPDKRLGLHSEVSAILSALMNRESDIVAIGLVSTKYLDSPCNMCGNCRQFVSEMSTKYGWNANLYLFSKDTEESKIYTIEEYLPSAWTSKKWGK